MRATDGDEVVFPIDGEVDEGVEVLWPLPESLPELIAQAAAKKPLESGLVPSEFHR